MKWRFLMVAIAMAMLFCVDCYAKRVIIRDSRDIEKAGISTSDKLVVKEQIDLKGQRLVLPTGTLVVFRGGSFKNGTLVGNGTTVGKTKKNVFTDCQIEGTWKVDYAYSTMFDMDMDAIKLLRNLSKLSSFLKLSSKRSYQITAKGDELDVEYISSMDKEKPLIAFHTIDPNIEGIILFGKNVEICNICFTDDYNPQNDEFNGANNIRNGNMIAICSHDKRVQSLSIKGCDFSGGTSSSFVASSQTRKCIVENCSFSGYIGDHAIYCSLNIETFSIRNCTVVDVPNTRGLFKIRSSKNARLFEVKDVTIHNLNGYLANVGLLETPDCMLFFDNISLTRDEGNGSVFYGFCVNDETKTIAGKGYNANIIRVKDCRFEYGYPGHSLLYHGAGTQCSVKAIEYVNDIMSESNISGGQSDILYVSNCELKDLSAKSGMALRGRVVRIEHTKITVADNVALRYLFLLNNYDEAIESISMNDVIINGNMMYLMKVTKGNRVKVELDKCTISVLEKDLFYLPTSFVMDYSDRESVIKQGDR